MRKGGREGGVGAVTYQRMTGLYMSWWTVVGCLVAFLAGFLRLMS